MKLLEAYKNITNFEFGGDFSLEIFLEHLSKSNKNELLEFINYIFEKDDYMVSHWIYLLSFKLAYLQDKKDKELLKLAIKIISPLDPEHDEVAKFYLTEFEKIKNEHNT